MRRLIAAFLVLLGLAPAAAQSPSFPQTLPANTVVGRLGVGPGPAQAIPFSRLITALDSINGPGSSTVGNVAVWDNLTGSSLANTGGTASINLSTASGAIISGAAIDLRPGGSTTAGVGIGTNVMAPDDDNVTALGDPSFRWSNLYTFNATVANSLATVNATVTGTLTVGSSSSTSVRERLTTSRQYFVRSDPVTVTITIASPGVVTWSTHGLSANAAVVFNTTSALPTGLTAGTVYYVKTVLSANTFTVSATPGGAVINTSGSQSGTQTAQTGSDSNTGLTSGSPFLTIQQCINTIAYSLDLNSKFAKCSLADGIYRENVLAQPTTGQQPGFTSVSPQIESKSGTRANVVINGGSGTALYTSQTTVWVFKNLTITSSSICALADAGWMVMDGVDLVQCTGNGLMVIETGLMEIIGNYTVDTCGSSHIVAKNFALWEYFPGITVTVTGTPACSTSWALVESNSVILTNSVTYSGSATGTRWIARYGGIISSEGVNPDTIFPGNANGTEDLTIATSVTVGVTGPGGTTGTINLGGATSGLVSIKPQAAAGTYTLTLPSAAGTSGQALLYGTPMTFGTLGPAAGGTGVANNAANTLTFSGNFALTLTLSNTTSVTLPTSGTLATLAGSEAFTNKTYNGNTWTAGTGTLTIAAGKTLTANASLTLTGTDSTTMTFPSTSQSIPGLSATQTFTGINNFQGSGSSAQPMGIISINGDAVAGPLLDIYRNSSSPASADDMGFLIFSGNNDNCPAGVCTKKNYAQMGGHIVTVTSGAEEGRYDFLSFVAGSNTYAMFVGAGLLVATSPATMPGSGNITATGTIRANTGFSANGTAGLSATTTVRDAAGTGTCTLIFTQGLKTGGTC